MLYYQKSAIVGLAIGLTTIILGIVSLSTPAWVTIDYSHTPPITYGLFHDPTMDAAKGLSMTTLRASQVTGGFGHFCLTVGTIMGVWCIAFIDELEFILSAAMFMVLGIMLDTTGLVYYFKAHVDLERFGANTHIDYGYSLGLMIVTILFALLLTVHISFMAGYKYRQIVFRREMQ